ncbi:amidohydrolase family protein, partial [Vibrio harveyi]
YLGALLPPNFSLKDKELFKGTYEEVPIGWLSFAGFIKCIRRSIKLGAIVASGCPSD